MPDRVTLEFLAQQQARILSELGNARAERADMRADMTVLLAIVQRSSRAARPNRPLPQSARPNGGVEIRPKRPI
jgi:hypothetical protein